MKKIIAILLIIIMINLLGCSNQGDQKVSENPNDYLALVTDTAGINDGSFNQLAWEGLQRAKKDFGFDIKYLESIEEDDFKPNIKSFANCGLDMLFCVGYEMSDAVDEIAEIYPNECYTMINYTFDEPIANVLCVEFEDQQAAFEVGYLAGNETKTQKVGFIGGIKSGIMDAFEYGFRAGVAKAVKDLKKEVSIKVEYIDSFSDEDEAKKAADKMYDDGVDIIYHSVGGAGLGVIKSAKRHDKYVVGSDMDQNKLAPKNVISSTIRNINDVVYNIAKEIKVVDDVKEITGKSRLLGMKENAVGIAASTKNMVSKNLMNKLNSIESDIKNAKIDPPYNKETFNEYMSKI